MTMFLIQSAILLAIAFVLGAIIGCLLKRMFAADDVAIPVATAAVATAATVAAQVQKSESAPAPEPEPLPQPVPAPAVSVPVMAAAAAKPKPAPKPKAPAKPKAAPKAVLAVKPAAVKAKAVATSSVKDDLKLIVGIGPVNERKLNAHGVATFAQIAGWKKPDIVEAEKYLEFDGRIEREQWVRQAKKLATGGKSEDAGELARQGKGSSKEKPAKAQVSKVEATSAKAKSAAVKPAAVKPAATNTVAAKPVAAKATTAKPATKPVALMGSGIAKTAKSSTTKSASKVAAKPTAGKPAKKPMAVKLAKPVGGKPDNLTLINGIGNVIEKKLHDLGVFHFEQVANWNDEQAAHFSKIVGFPGRAKREGWMKEAALFAKGGTTEHARKVEAGDIPTSRKSTKAEKTKK